MDKRAQKILFDTYWSASGWVQGERRVPTEDFEYAKAHGVMFDPLSQTHDETIAQLRTAVARLNPRQAADGFIASLSTRRLDWRSALGSYSVARWLPAHAATAGERQCRVCGLNAGRYEHDLNVLNFERLKWGGVRHSSPIYALMDMDLFVKNPPPAPSAEDLRIFRELMSIIRTAPVAVSSAALSNSFAGVLKSNKPERDQLIAILGLCGLLGTQEHPGFAKRFVPYSDRALPNHRFVDMAYPACWWSGAVGLNEDLLQDMFGHAL